MFAVVIGIQSKERVEGSVVYTVDRKTGNLSVGIGAEDVVLPEATLRVGIHCMKPRPFADDGDRAHSRA
jgi:hypothetical protein